MKGKNHVISGLSTILAIDGTVGLVSKLMNNDLYTNMHTTIANFSFIDATINNVINGIITAVICIILYIIGCLIPDIDQEKSTLGRFIHIPVDHRTWTHTIWMVILLAIPAIFAHCFVWLAFGCAVHIFWDSLSKGGICWFYPISKYKTWSSGAQIKNKHFIYLYHTGDITETILTIFTGITSAGLFTLNIMKIIDII